VQQDWQKLLLYFYSFALVIFERVLARDLMFLKSQSALELRLWAGLTKYVFLPICIALAAEVFELMLNTDHFKPSFLYMEDVNLYFFPGQIKVFQGALATWA